MMGMCLCDVCFASKKSSEREFFVPTRTHLGVKLLTPKSVLVGTKNSHPKGGLGLP